MAVEERTRRETETPTASDSQPAKTKTGQNMALLLSLIHNDCSRHIDADDDANSMREAETLPASDSQPAKTKMGQNMALVLSLPDNGSSIHDDYFNPMNEERAIVFAQQSMDGDDDYVPPPPLRIVRPESLENEQEKCPGFHYEEGARKARTNNTSTGIFYTRRGRPSAKSKTGQKPALFDSSCGSSSYSKGEKDDDFEPPTPARKRGRPSRSKTAKRKMERESLLVDRSSSSEVSDDDGQKKYARVKGSAWDRAEEVMKKLPAESCFVKCMKHSQVVKGFWLGLPAEFCRNNIPEEDVDIVLEDEDRHTCTTKYLAYKTGLSGGWKGFAEQHDLKVGDTLVFQLVQPTRFKVYILRENKFTTTDGALGLLSLDKSRETNTSNKEEKESSEKDAMSNKVPRKKKKKVTDVVTKVCSKPSINDSDNQASEEAAGSGFSYRDPDSGDFVAVKSLMDFKILLRDDSVVGPVVLPDGLCKTYYSLCLARKEFLHRHITISSELSTLPKQLRTTFTTGMIVQVANIAECIMAASPSSLTDLAMWKKTLESLKSLGMDVDFMIKRVDKIVGLLSTPSSSTMEEPQRYKKVKLERASVAKQVKDVELTLSILKDSVRKMDMETEEMEKASVKKKERAVRALATKPW